MGGHRKRVLEPYRSFIIKRINQTPHLTLHGLKVELAARGVKVSHDTVCKFLRREGLRFKKYCLPLSMPVPTLPAGGGVGDRFRPVSIHGGWCSSLSATLRLPAGQ
jgi:transposase